MKAIGIIPARYGATRFPGKCLVPIAGKPLVQWVVERARQARSLAEVIVATDDERIARAVTGARVEMTSPQHPTGTDRLAEVAARIPCDMVVNIQGDEPLLPVATIEALVETLAAAPAVSMATCARRILDARDLQDPNVVKVVFDKGGDALYFSRWPIPFVRDSGTAVTHFRHVGIYAYRREFLLQYVRWPQTPLEQAEKLEQLRALENGHRIRVVLTEQTSIGVDTPEDVARVEALLRESVPWGRTTLSTPQP